MAIKWLPSNNWPMPALAVLLTASLAIAGTQAKERSPAPQHKAHKSGHYGRKAKPRPRGQQAIEGERARQIQDALAREHYLSGQPSGVWDSSTEEAMRHYQSDHGWQTRTVPDSRALIRLGLGPGHEHLLNPESAITGGPQVARENPVAVSSVASSGPTAPSSVSDQAYPSAPNASPAAAPTR